MIHFQSNLLLIHLGKQWRIVQVLVLAIRVGDPDGVPGCWSESVLAVAAIWGSESEVKDSLSLSLSPPPPSSAFQIK